MRRRYYGHAPLVDRNKVRAMRSRVRARQAYDLYMTGVRWSDVAATFGYSRGSAARDAVKRILTSAQIAALPVRAMARSCECMNCVTCASRERMAAYFREDMDAYHAWARLGTALRRKHLGQGADMTPTVDLALRRKVKRCPLCQCKLIDAPWQPRSKELDHIVPVCLGGTHTLGNVRIICRACNGSRPYDGSDLVGVQTSLGSVKGGVA
jgi:hypothetical protein